VGSAGLRGRRTAESDLRVLL